MATPALRIRIAPKFPAKIQSGVGIGVSRTGGAVTIRQDWSNVQEQSGPLPDGAEVLVRDPTTGSYARADFLEATEGGKFTPQFDFAAPVTIRKALSEQMSIASVAGTGSIGNGSLDAGAVLQRAHDQWADAGYKAATLLVPPAEVAYLLDSPFVCSDVAMTIKGLGQVYGPVGGGALFKIADPGFDPMTFTSVLSRGSGLHNVGFIQDQPSVVSLWEPTDYPDIVKCDDMLGEFFLHDVFAPGVTRGFCSVGSGRAHIRNFRGQFFKRGIYIDDALDCPVISDVHGQLYWTSLADVTAYMQAGLDLVVMGRCDTPKVENVFGIVNRSVLRFIETASGYTTQFRGGVIDGDKTKYTVWVQSNFLTGGIAQLGAQSELFSGAGATVVGGRAIYVEGTDARFKIGQLSAQRYAKHAIETAGTNNHLTIGSGSDFWLCNQDNDGSGIVKRGDASNIVQFDDTPFVRDSNGASLFHTGGIGVVGLQQNVPSGAVNEVRAYATVSGQNPRISSSGGDANSDLDITGNGTGGVNIPALHHTGTGALVTRSVVETRLNAEVSLTDYALPALDGSAHPLSEVFSTLGAAQAKYSWVTSLTQDRLDVAFQAAINDLPQRGGTVIVPSGNYAALTPANLVMPPLHSVGSGRKSHTVVQWRVNQADLPRGMPGVVMRLGNFREYRQGGPDNGRFGDALVHYRVDGWETDPTGGNQEDAIVRVEATVPSTATAPVGEDSLVAAFQFDMSSKSTDVGASIRGVHGYVTGDGGKAKLRAMRTLARGVGGHAGICTGVMFSATRQGVIPIDFGGDGTTEYTPGQSGNYGSSIDFAVVGQVGPGIRGVFYAQSFDVVPAQPQSVFAMASGAAALKPTIAAVDLHAGGTGKVVRITKNENDTSTLATWENDGTIVAPTFRSNVARPGTADDAVISFAPTRNSGVIILWAEGVQNSFAMFFYRATSSPVINSMVKGSLVDFLAGGTVPTGTTGTDTHLSISATDGAIYVENRLGSSVVIQWMALG